MSIDKGFSWAIAFACCFINCLMYGVIRLSGLLMVSTVETFQVSRGKAALPFSVSTSVRNLSGIFVGYLGHKCGLSIIISSGCLLAALGAGLCFFVSDIFWLTLCWGGIFGIGCGLATCLLPLAINQHFEKHRGTASGISYSGGYIGSFIFPPIVMQLFEHYGLQGAFLVISATLLNGLAASLLFRKPPCMVAKDHQPASSNFINNDHSSHHEYNYSSVLKSNDQCRRFWNKLMYHIRRRDKTIEPQKLSETSHEPPNNLIANVPLSVQSDNTCILNRYTDINKSIAIETNASINPTSFSIKRVTNPELSSRLGDFYFRSRSYQFKSKSNVEYKSNTANLRKILLDHFFKKRYSFSSDSLQLPTEGVKLVSFINVDFIVCPIFITSMNRTEYHLNVVSNNEYVCNNSIFKALLYQKADVKLDCKSEPALNKLVDSVEFTATRNLNNQGKEVHSLKSSNKPFQTNETFEMYKLDSGAIGNCSRRISIHNQCHVSYPPLGIPPISKQFGNQKSDFHSKEKSLKTDKSRRIQSQMIKDIGNCCFDWFRMYTNPMFVVITTTMSMHTFVIVCMITIIEDFAKDLHVPANQVHYVIMALSIADLLGALTMGMIADRRIMSKCYFIVLCFFGTGVSSIAISFSCNLTMLLTLVAFYGIFATGVIITFPLLIAQFIEVKKQAVALASSNVLSSPTVLLVPLVIGYFRDQIGSYTGVFQVLGIASFSSSFIWLLAPYLIGKYRNYKQFRLHNSQC